MEQRRGPSHALAVIVGSAWLAAAIGLGTSGLLLQLPRPDLQKLLALLTFVLLTGACFVPPMREWVRGLSWRCMIGLHLTRAVAGAYFLVLYRQGRLPYDFAVLGGIGDIVIAMGAGVLLLMSRSRPLNFSWLFAWNILGLADILFVVRAAAMNGMRDPTSMVELTQLPLSLLPTFLVPLIIASHIVMLARMVWPWMSAMAFRSAFDQNGK